MRALKWTALVLMYFLLLRIMYVVLVDRKHPIAATRCLSETGPDTPGTSRLNPITGVRYFSCPQDESP